MAKTTFSGPVLEGKEGVNIETKTSNYTVTTGDSGKTFVSELKLNKFSGVTILVELNSPSPSYSIE